MYKILSFIFIFIFTLVTVSCSSAAKAEPEKKTSWWGKTKCKLLKKNDECED